MPPQGPARLAEAWKSGDLIPDGSEEPNSFRRGPGSPRRESVGLGSVSYGALESLFDCPRRGPAGMGSWNPFSTAPAGARLASARKSGDLVPNCSKEPNGVRQGTWIPLVAAPGKGLAHAWKMEILCLIGVERRAGGQFRGQLEDN